MRRAAKVDSNHRQIVRTLEAHGFSVLSLAEVGNGAPDLAVGFGGRTYLVEVKDGSLIPSRRRLRPNQEAWHRNWRGHVAVIDSAQKAAEWARDIRGLPRPSDEVSTQQRGNQSPQTRISEDGGRGAA